jgi:hypothetical protein
MFLTELAPLFQTGLAQPIAFVGGIVAGALRLNLQDEPLQSWLARHGGGTSAAAEPNAEAGPTSITID